MIVVGGRVFYEVNVAFHLIRRSVWEPWETIGAYVTCSSFAKCRYLSKYDRITEQFALEVEDAGRLLIAGSKEFLELWRKDHQDPTSVISHIINYCTVKPDFPRLLTDLYTRYVGNNSAKTFARLAIMLKQRERHFPSALAVDGIHTELKRLLQEAKLI